MWKVTSSVERCRCGGEREKLEVSKEHSVDKLSDISLSRAGRQSGDTEVELEADNQQSSIPGSRFIIYNEMIILTLEKDHCWIPKTAMNDLEMTTSLTEASSEFSQ